MQNPLRSEAEAFRFLVVVVAGAIVVAAASFVNTWLALAAAVVAVGGVIVWIMRGPATTKPAAVLVSGTPGATHRVLLVAEPGTSGIAGRIGERTTDVLVVVPALVSTMKSLTGAVDDERNEAQRTAEALAGDLSRAGLEARGVVGADDTVLAIEDALREFGADEIVLASGDDALLAKVRERFAVPVSRL
ncbi:MAG TPA: hypothetical protein VF327_08530 [Gaiellaceae bacterium]